MNCSRYMHMYKPQSLKFPCVGILLAVIPLISDPVVSKPSLSLASRTMYCFRTEHVTLLAMPRESSVMMIGLSVSYFGRDRRIFFFRPRPALAVVGTVV